VLTEDSVLGKALHTLIGYVSRPDGIQILLYVRHPSRHMAVDAIGREAGKATDGGFVEPGSCDNRCSSSSCSAPPERVRPLTPN